MRLVLGMLLFAGAIAVVAQATQDDVRRVYACTPGPPFGLEAAAQAKTIAIVEVVRTGSAINTAPTAEPWSLPTRDDPSLPSSPPEATTVPYTFDLTGYGATLSVLRVIAGDAPATIEAGWEARAFMEQEIRRREAYRGPAIIFSNCPIEWSTHRWETGGRYLVFLGESPAHRVIFRNRVEGDDLALEQHPERESLWYMEALGMQEGTYHRHFPGIAATVENGIAIITAERVPLAFVLRAIADLRGDSTIAPPGTGSAGLRSTR